MYDVIIIGGGPAGSAAAVYCSRKNLKTLLLTDTFGGQSVVSDDIQNWIGEPHIAGIALAKKFEDHVRTYEEVIDIKIPEKAVSVKKIRCGDDKRDCDFEVTTDKDNTYQGKAVIVTAGARRRKLGVPGEEDFNGKGVAYCSTCDAPLFKGKNVAVVGGGNAGLEAVVDLLPYATKIYLMERGDTLKGDQVTQEKIKNEAKVEIMYNVETVSVSGKVLMDSLKYKDIKSGEEHDLAVQGVFIEIGSVPNSEMVADLVKIDKRGQIEVNLHYGSTSHSGIFAAGDVTNDIYKQNNISVGDAVRAALSAYAYINELKKDE